MVLMPGKLLDELSRATKADAFEAFSVDDFVHSEETAIAELSETELRVRVLDRTKQLAENRKFFGLRLHEALASFLEKFEAQAQDAAERALGKARAENEDVTAEAVAVAKDEVKAAERAE